MNDNYNTKNKEEKNCLNNIFMSFAKSSNRRKVMRNIKKNISDLFNSKSSNIVNINSINKKIYRPFSSTKNLSENNLNKIINE